MCGVSREASVVGTYDLRVSSALRDADWDRFLSAASGGHHLQSSYWGAVKAVLWLAGKPAGRYTMKDVLGL